MSASLNCTDEDKSLKKLNSDDNQNLSLNYSNANSNQNFKTSTRLKTKHYATGNQLDKTNISHKANQLNQTERKLMCNLLSKSDLDDCELKSQDAKSIIKITKMNLKNSLPTNIRELNTQQFMDLNLTRIVEQLQPSPLQTCNNQTVESMDSDDLVAVTSPVSKSSKDLQQNSKNTSKFNKTSSENNIPSSADLGVPNPTQPSSPLNSIYCSEVLNSNLSIQDQDSELITFQAMCEEMLNTKPVIANDYENKKNTMTIGFKRVNQDVLSCVNFTNRWPKSPKLNLSTNSIDTVSNKSNLASKKRPLSCETSYLPSKLFRKQNENQTNKVNFQDSNDLNMPVLSLSEDKDSCVLIEDERVKDRNKTPDCKNVSVGLSEENKCSIEVMPILTCSPHGQIHKDMLDYFNRKNLNNIC